MKLTTTFFLFFFAAHAFAQKHTVFQIDSISDTGTLLDKNWKCKTGDDLDWAKPDFDDSVWQTIDPTKEISELPSIFNDETKWLRLNFEIKKHPNEPLGLAVRQAGASEIYLNGKLIHRFGYFDADSSKIKAYDPLEDAIYFPADSIGRYTLAVRLVLQPNIRYTNIFGLTKNRFFSATILKLHPTLEAQRNFLPYFIGLDVFVIGVAFMLFLLHAAFFIYNRSNKTNLLLVAYFFGMMIIRIYKIIGQHQHVVADRYWSLNISNSCMSIVIVLLALVIYRMAKARLDVFFFFVVVFQLAYSFASAFSVESPLQTQLLLIGNLCNFFVLIRVVRMGLKKGIKGFWTVGTGLFIAVLGLVGISTAFLFLNFGHSSTGYNVMRYGVSPYFIDVFFTITNISIPIGLSLFMAIEGNETNKALSKKLIENEQLKNDAIELEKEKQHILETQNDTLEKQVAERTAELNASLDNLKSTQNQLIQSEKLASLGELTAGIAHEIQNPLNFVNNFAEVSAEMIDELKEELEKGDTDEVKVIAEDLQLNLGKINHHGKRASSIVKGMLEHSRASSGVKEPTNLNALAEEYLRLAYHGLRAKDNTFNVTIETHFDPYLPLVPVIPQDIGRVLLNLINNAFYAVVERSRSTVGAPLASAPAPYQPTVTISTQKTADQIIIKVQDNGNGIPESIREKIFQPFFTTKPTGQGTGLGLSLAYDIITKGHGGKLHLESIINQGSTFTIELPFTNPKN